MHPAKLALAHVQRIAPRFNSSSASPVVFQTRSHKQPVAVEGPWENQLWRIRLRRNRLRQASDSTTDVGHLGGNVGERGLSHAVRDGSRCVMASLISPQLTYGLPNPPQGGLLIMMLFSPLLHRWLTPHPQSMWLDYLGGIAALGLPLMFVWSTGMGGFVCGGYLTVVLWIGSALRGGDFIFLRSDWPFGTPWASTSVPWAARCSITA